MSKKIHIEHPENRSVGPHGGHLRPGQIMERPPRNRSQAYGGVHPLTAFAQGSQKFQPLPEPLGQPPYYLDLESIIPGIEKQAGQLGKLVFHAVGDTGGVKDPEYQASVANPVFCDRSGWLFPPSRNECRNRHGRPRHARKADCL